MKSGKLGNEAVGLFLAAFILFIEGITTLRDHCTCSTHVKEIHPMDNFTLIWTIANYKEKKMGGIDPCFGHSFCLSLSLYQDPDVHLFLC